MKKLLTFLFAAMFAMPCFATGVSGNAGTCDSGALGTDNGSTILRANYEPETIHLRWYDENNDLLTVNSASQSCTYGESITIPTAPTKTGYRFTGWHVFTDYTPIEYIESTGTQWIDTGITRNVKGVTIETDVLITDWTKERAFVGLKEARNSFELYSNTWPNGSSGISLYNSSGGYYANAVGLNPNAIHTVRAGLSSTNIILNVDGVSYDANIVPTSFVGSFVLFKLRDGYYAKVKMYYFKLYGDGTLLRDMIPVKDISGTPCMYDKVSGQFFYNQGTGDFIAGPDL